MPRRSQHPTSPRSAVPPAVCRRRAFTLIELLTVIAVIGILAAILIPTVGRVRESARSSHCASNLRQLQLANIAYATATRDGTFVPVFINGSDSAATGRVIWHSNPGFVSMVDIRRPIVSLTDVKTAWPREIVCPLATIDGGRIDRAYAYNRTGLAALYSAPGAMAAVRVSDVARPAATIAFVDAVNWMMNYDVPLGVYTGEVTQDNTPAPRHNDFANAAFFDGHVSKIPRERLLSDENLWRIGR